MRLGVFVVGVPFVLVALGVGLGAGRPVLRDVESWSRARGLRLTDGNRPMVSYYLRTSGQLRIIGTIAGAALPALVVLAYDARHGIGALWGIAWAYVGYLVGSLYAELTLARPPSARRTASLTTRALPSYLSPRHVWAQRALAAGIAGAGMVAALLPPASAVWMNGFGTGREPAALAVAAIVVAAGVEMLERWVVRRPQPLSRADLVAADDAIRSQSVHSLCGSGLALLVLLASAQAAVLASRDLGDLRRPVLAASAAGLLASYVTCMRLGHRPWRVRRSVVMVP